MWQKNLQSIRINKKNSCCPKTIEEIAIKMIKLTWILQEYQELADLFKVNSQREE
jgi:hypothetical protein